MSKNVSYEELTAAPRSSTMVTLDGEVLGPEEASKKNRSYLSWLVAILVVFLLLALAAYALYYSRQKRARECARVGAGAAALGLAAHRAVVGGEGAAATIEANPADRLLVNYWSSEHCGGCRAYAPAFQEGLAAIDQIYQQAIDRGLLSVIQTDLAKGAPQRILEKMGIRAIPTVVAYRGDQEVARLENGRRNAGDLVDFVRSLEANGAAAPKPNAGEGAATEQGPAPGPQVETAFL